MKILSLNTQKGYQENLEASLAGILASDAYDFILFQEAVQAVIAPLRSDTYSLLQPPGTQLAIWYRNSFALEDSLLHVLERKHPGIYPHPHAYGLLLGTFDTGEGRVQIGSIHLHSGIRPGTRLKQLGEVKRLVMERHLPGTHLICGGDFNLGVPGELKRTYRTLAPEFRLVTKDLGPTLDSRYTEAYPSITNTAARALGRFGLSLRFPSDHFFTDVQTAEGKAVGTSILPNRMSDHLPILLELA